ncbi:MAG: uncharacterized protein A8A55_0977 [Amphiamblys sp. WSBS2006]|nr:MAG: uncharacterized protein A8A55_0977 [Amphiamblys sp. WSBS2006]
MTPTKTEKPSVQEKQEETVLYSKEPLKELKPNRKEVAAPENSSGNAEAKKTYLRSVFHPRNISKLTDCAPRARRSGLFVQLPNIYSALDTQDVRMCFSVSGQQKKHVFWSHRR